ncbi:MAG: DUF5683 domain-containing protein [Bacteroidota bacterium]
MLRYTLYSCLWMLMIPKDLLAYAPPARVAADTYLYPLTSSRRAYIRSVPPSRTPRRKPRKQILKPTTPPTPGEMRGRLLQQEPTRTQYAWLYASLLPGLGQTYQRCAWKVPIIYGVFTGLAWGAITNHQDYRQSRRTLIRQGVNGSYVLANYVASRKRERNLFIAIMGLWYVINIIDAYVTGTLTTFDVSDNLDIIVQPTRWNKATSKLSLRPVRLAP